MSNTAYLHTEGKTSLLRLYLLLSLFLRLAPFIRVATVELSAQPIWQMFLCRMPFLSQPSPESALTRATPVLGLTQSFTHHNYSLQPVSFVQFEPLSNFVQPICHVFGLWGKLEHLEETHADTGRTCKLHTERHPCSAGTQSRGLLTVRQQCYPLSHPELYLFLIEFNFPSNTIYLMSTIIHVSEIPNTFL